MDQYGVEKAIAQVGMVRQLMLEFFAEVRHGEGRYPLDALASKEMLFRNAFKSVLSTLEG